MSHYLTKEEIETKTAEINRLQEDPDYCSCVTHDVTGEHPEHIFVHEINHYNR